MKTIHLLRHAKSSWNDPSLEDESRPLNSRGRKNTQLMARPIFESGCEFENLYVSAAQRAKETIERLAAALPLEVCWQLTPTLYTFSELDLLQFIGTLNDVDSQVMLVGHNPGLTSLANLLGDQEIDNIPTCGYVRILIETHSWAWISSSFLSESQLPEISSATELFLYPKLFERQG